MKVKEESEKVGLRLNIQKTKIMASGPLTSWEIDGETDKMVSDFTFGVSKITADGDCTMKLKHTYAPGESHGQRSLVGYNPWGRKKSDTTERLD